VHRLFARVLAFPRITVAAVNGHAFAGGFMLALAHDLRVMRADRGFLCLPEVDLRLPLQPGMTALIQAKLRRQAAHEAIVTGRRFGAADALARGLVDEVAEEAAVLPRAIALAAELAAKDPATLAGLKRGLHGEALRLLETPAGLASAG
jgi:enoyl-CoA hydratase/carnithine racemase